MGSGVAPGLGGESSIGNSLAADSFARFEASSNVCVSLSDAGMGSAMAVDAAKIAPITAALLIILIVPDSIEN